MDAEKEYERCGNDTEFIIILDNISADIEQIKTILTSMEETYTLLENKIKCVCGRCKKEVPAKDVKYYRYSRDNIIICQNCFQKEVNEKEYDCEE